MCYVSFRTVWTHAYSSVYHEIKMSEMHNVALYKYGIVRPCALECAPQHSNLKFLLPSAHDPCI